MWYARSSPFCTGRPSNGLPTGPLIYPQTAVTETTSALGVDGMTDGAVTVEPTPLVVAPLSRGLILLRPENSATHTSIAADWFIVTVTDCAPPALFVAYQISAVPEQMPSTDRSI